MPSRAASRFRTSRYGASARTSPAAAASYPTIATWASCRPSRSRSRRSSASRSDVVSAGNSANLEWLRSTEHVGRINNLRLGESILLGRDPLHGVPDPWPAPGRGDDLRRGDRVEVQAATGLGRARPRPRSRLRWSRQPTTSSAAGSRCSGSGIRTPIRSTSPRHPGCGSSARAATTSSIARRTAPARLRDRVPSRVLGARARDELALRATDHPWRQLPRTRPWTCRRCRSAPRRDCARREALGHGASTSSSRGRHVTAIRSGRR